MGNAMLEIHHQLALLATVVLEYATRFAGRPTLEFMYLEFATIVSSYLNYSTEITQVVYYAHREEYRS